MEDAKSLVRRFVEEVWNEGRLERIAAFFTPDFVDHTPVAPELPTGIEGARAIVALFRRAFPDLEFTILDMVAEGDRIAWRWCSTGTHRGEALGVGPTGRRATVEGIELYRLRDGRIAERWGVFDALGMMGQLGMVGGSVGPVPAGDPPSEVG